MLTRILTGRGRRRIEHPSVLDWLGLGRYVVAEVRRQPPRRAVRPSAETTSPRAFTPADAAPTDASGAPATSAPEVLRPQHGLEPHRSTNGSRARSGDRRLYATPSPTALVSLGALVVSVALWVVLAADIDAARAGAVLVFLATGPTLVGARMARSLGAATAAAVGLAFAAVISAATAAIMLTLDLQAPTVAVLVVSALVAAAATSDLVRWAAHGSARTWLFHPVAQGAAAAAAHRSVAHSSPADGARAGAVPRRLRSPIRGGHVSAAAGALVGGQLIRMAGGVVFWGLAARTFPASDVGIAASAVAAMMICVQLSVAGAGSSVILLYPQTAAPQRLLLAAFKFVVIASLAISGAMVAIGAFALGGLTEITRDPVFIAVFVAACVLGTCGGLANEVSVATARPAHIVVRSAALSATMLAMLGAWTLAALPRTSDVIFSCWAAGELIACVLIAVQMGLLRRRRSPRSAVDATIRSVAVTMRAIATRAIGQHALTLADRTPPLLMTLVITEIHSPELGAYWYTLWMAALAVLLVPMYFGTALFAELARERAIPWPRVVRNSARTLAVGVIAALLLALLAGDVLGLLGSAYRVNGERALQLLTVSVVSVTILQTYYAVCRSTDRLREATTTALIMGAAAMALGAWLSRSHALEGVAVAWLVCQAPAAAWALWRMRRLARRLKQPHPRASIAADVVAGHPAAREAGQSR